ncbi:hypothetical protein NG99_16975 [Erwinia typographi]|uniref:Uncharacterized protein n=1 Tax=Erwinia typographi TaxID=371042 RepID=A0A0A3Z0G5_9GAMM|nr:hypothetical protein [Erwinia typographi]KGT91259.1 hypothetical protein NG99_16975 [Erwinia typographi]
MYVEDRRLKEKDEYFIVKLERVMTAFGCQGLSRWEYDFINGLSRYFRGGKYLTRAQKSAARKVINKYRQEEAEPTRNTLASKFAPVCRENNNA